MLRFLKFFKRTPLEEEKLVEVGKITGYFRIPKAAVVELIKGTLKIGDEIIIKGPTTNFKQKVKSLQIDCKPIPEAKQGMEFGLQVRKKVRRSDKVYKASL